MNVNELIQILNKYQISIKKRYGQNFLIDNNVLNNIVSKAINDEEINNINVIEIGPGLGFLTEKLIDKAKKVVSYEIDEEFIPVLKDKFKDKTNFSLINQDFLTVDLLKDIHNEFNDGPIKVIANLPYYITTSILLKILEETSSVTQMIVMMQKEVANRLAGKPQTKDYNSLSVLIQYFTNVRILFNVSPNSFYPQPEVDSSVVLIEYKDEIKVKANNLPYFLKFNRIIFSQRRKTIVNNILHNFDNHIYTRDLIEKVLLKENLNLSVRAESLTVTQIVLLANRFYETVNNLLN